MLHNQDCGTLPKQQIQSFLNRPKTKPYPAPFQKGLLRPKKPRNYQYIHQSLNQYFIILILWSLSQATNPTFITPRTISSWMSVGKESCSSSFWHGTRLAKWSSLFLSWKWLTALVALTIRGKWYTLLRIQLYYEKEYYPYLFDKGLYTHDTHSLHPTTLIFCLF